MAPEPIRRFRAWFAQARRCRSVVFPEAMCLSTIAADGRPDGRIVLLKQVDPQGFVFYTDTRSAKGRALRRRPEAALTWYWEPLRRQVRVQGRVRPVSGPEADAYFRSRPRASQIAAWASHQSAPLASRAVLERKVRTLTRRFAGGPVPRPPYWSGFRVVPRTVEFWQERPNRLHDRWQCVRTAGRGWTMRRLSP